jgi:uncharacterized sulfatase
MFSGLHFWQTGLGAIEQGTKWDSNIPTFPTELMKAGYRAGYSYEGDQGKLRDYLGESKPYHQAGRDFGDFSMWVSRERFNENMDLDRAKQALFDEVRGNFRAFLDDKQQAGSPWFYCWGPTVTHRDFEPGSGKALWDIDPDALQGKMPQWLPDVPKVREDVTDYLGECCALDGGLGELLAELEARGELDSTLIIVAGDHGMPFPRAKASLYDTGCQVGLAARWPSRIAPGQVVSDFVNTREIGPTICDAAGLVGLQNGLAAVDDSGSSTSLLPLLSGSGSASGRQHRHFAVSGLERHVCISREGHLPYPQRAIRTHEHLMIANFEPDRWPMGDPHGLENAAVDLLGGVEGGDPTDLFDPLRALSQLTMVAFSDCDASPTKAYLVMHRAEDGVAPLFQMCLGRKPRRELYDIRADPHCMTNLLAADDSSSSGGSGGSVSSTEHKQVAEELERMLIEEVLKPSGDPRVVDAVCRYEKLPYAGLIGKYTTEQGIEFLQKLEETRGQWRSRRASKPRL